MPVASAHLELLLKKKISKTILLARWPRNRLYYVVKLKKINPKKNEYLVEYEDKVEAWSPREELHLQYYSSSFPQIPDEAIVCCICEGPESQQHDQLLICDTCQQGYHQKCHSPTVEQVPERWHCACCEYIDCQASKGPIISTSTPKKVIVKVNDESTEESLLEPEALPPPEALVQDPIKEVPLIAPRERPVTIEKMQPEIIDVAKALIQKDPNNTSTQQFVESMASEDKPVEKVKDKAAKIKKDKIVRLIKDKDKPKTKAPRKALSTAARPA